MGEGTKSRLNSWQEIADYLGKDVRTVMRWEKERALPVRRVPGGRRDIVFSYREEIDAWLARASPALPARSPERASTKGYRFRVKYGSLSPRWAVAAALVVLVAALTLFLIHTKTARQVTTAGMAGSRLLARDSEGRMVWSYQFSRPVRAVVPPVSFIGDVDGDGLTDVVFSVPFLGQGFGAQSPFSANATSGELYCFSHRGKLLWQVAFEETLTFGTTGYAPPWPTEHVTAYPSQGPRRILWILHHHTWWPGVLLLLDSQGKVLGRFFNSGWILSVNLLETASQRLLLAGGMSNATRSPMLAVLDENNISGSSPEEPGSQYECKNCPAGKPVRYYVFPRSELSQSDSWLSEIRASDQEIVARIFVGPGVASGVEEIYEFSPDFQLRRVSFSDNYPEAHEELQRRGVLQHSFEECPERAAARPVRVWEPSKGWMELPHPSRSGTHLDLLEAAQEADYRGPLTIGKPGEAGHQSFLLLKALGNLLNRNGIRVGEVAP